VVKEALSQLGLCRPDVRPPISTLSDSERAEVAAILASLDLSTSVPA
jgi:4-hydroxy-tetrahydrodipicolinate synthase